MAHEIITKNELIQKLQAIQGNPKVYVGGQFSECGRMVVASNGIIDVEVGPVNVVPAILLIEQE